MPSPTKKTALTFNQLASYDDFLTDALVDHAYYWTKVPKNRAAYHPSRGVREEEIARIIQTEIILHRDLDTAEKKLFATEGFRKYYASLKTPAQRDDFRQHARRYMQVYLPECPFEVNSTNRYTIVSHEASITARRLIRRNETVRYLAGTSVGITPQEESDLADKKRNFSIVVSSRSGTMSLFMGPARFANHDCDANARLVTVGHAGIEIITTQDIGVGEEITVSYGNEYFGEDNCDCLCRTCEGRRVNGWAPAEMEGRPGEGVSVKKSIEDDSLLGYSLRRRRRDDSAAGSSRTPSATPSELRRRITRRLPMEKSFSRESAGSSSPVLSLSPDRKRRLADAVTTLIAPPAVKRRRVVGDADEDASVSVPASPCMARASSAAFTSSTAGTRSVSSAPSSSDDGDGVSTNATTPSESIREKNSPEPPRIDVPGMRKRGKAPTRRVGADNIIAFSANFQVLGGGAGPNTRSRIRLLGGGGTDSQAPTASANPETDPAPAGSGRSSSADVVLASVEPPETRPGDKPILPAGKRKYRKVVVHKATTPPAQCRNPGDYTLTPLLLSQPEMAWVHCTTCSAAFVQQNAYYTRTSCPRCERHSKLYGFVWPKTVRVGPRDKEERILDHRIVHRFLDHDDEARVRGKRMPADDEPREGEEATGGRGGAAEKADRAAGEEPVTPGGRGETGMSRGRSLTRKEEDAVDGGPVLRRSGRLTAAGGRGG